jgi:hypothetical protein
MIGNSARNLRLAACPSRRCHASACGQGQVLVALQRQLLGSSTWP